MTGTRLINDTRRQKIWLSNLEGQWEGSGTGRFLPVFLLRTVCGIKQTTDYLFWFPFLAQQEDSRAGCVGGCLGSLVYECVLGKVVCGFGTKVEFGLGLFYKAFSEKLFIFIQFCPLSLHWLCDHQLYVCVLFLTFD